MNTQLVESLANAVAALPTEEYALFQEALREIDDLIASHNREDDWDVIINRKNPIQNPQFPECKPNLGM